MTSTKQMIDAVKSGDTQQVEQLLATNPALVDARSEDGTSAVLLAKYYGRSALADILIKAGASLDLFEAAATGQLERVKQLLKDSPDALEAVSLDGYTPLHLAAYFGHASVVEFLLKAGAHVNAVSHNGQLVMPLHSAVSGASADVVRLLLAHGADVNAYQQDQFTPLHGSAQNGSLDITRMLIEASAAINPRAANGKTPLAQALESHHPQVAELLRQHGGVE